MKQKDRAVDLRCRTDAQIGPNPSEQARPRGFEPLTFGSVERRGSAESGSSKPNLAPQVAKKSPRSQNRGQFDRRQLAGLAGGHARSSQRAGAGPAPSQTTACRPERSRCSPGTCLALAQVKQAPCYPRLGGRSPVTARCAPRQLSRSARESGACSAVHRRRAQAQDRAPRIRMPGGGVCVADVLLRLRRCATDDPRSCGVSDLLGWAVYGASRRERTEVGPGRNERLRVHAPVERSSRRASAQDPATRRAWLAPHPRARPSRSGRARSERSKGSRHGTARSWLTGSVWTG
jgi:hypothetical protein